MPDRMLLALVARGDDYRPSTVPFTFTFGHDPGDLRQNGPRHGQPWEFGVSSYEVPASTPPGHEIAELHAQIMPILPAIRAAGAALIYVSFGYFHERYENNFEYSSEEMRLLAELGVPVWISTYGGEKETDETTKPTTPKT